MKECTPPIDRPRQAQRRPSQTFLIAATAWMLTACSATAPSPDLAPVPIDMTVVTPPLTAPSCGKIVLCTVQCGLGKLECTTQCAAGATATEAMKAATLGFCAVKNCAGSDAGTGVPAILGCLLSSCQSEVAACDGLF